MPKDLACCNELNKRDKTVGGNGVPVQKSIRENLQKAVSYSKQSYRSHLYLGLPSSLGDFGLEQQISAASMNKLFSFSVKVLHILSLICTERFS